jgi:hypothetical protein
MKCIKIIRRALVLGVKRVKFMRQIHLIRNLKRVNYYFKLTISID